MATSCLVALLAALCGVASASSRLEVIDLPVGFRPEGITFGRDWTAYVGSIYDGSIWKGNLKTGEGEVALPSIRPTLTGLSYKKCTDNVDAGESTAEGVICGGDLEMGESKVSMLDIEYAALGMGYDKRTDYLYVGGSTAGTLRVYDSDVNLVQEFTLVTEGGLVNELFVAEDYVYVSDSFKSQFYKLPLNKDGSFRDGADTVATTVRITGDGFPADLEEFVSIAESIASNGIVASDDESMLIISVMSEAKFYLVDSETGAAKLIDLGDDIVSGDGLVRRGNTLWVCSPGFVDGREIVVEIALSEDWTCGKVTRIFDSDLLVTPATGDLKNNGLYVVNAKFFTPAEEAESQTYEVIRLDRDEAKDSCSAS